MISAGIVATIAQPPGMPNVAEIPDTQLREMQDNNAIIKAKDAVIKALDQNGNGKIDIEDIIVLAIKSPGVHITRARFLKKELFKNYPQEVIDIAI